MELKGAKPGQFHPRCTACRGKFLLIIPTEPNRAPLVAAEEDRQTETVSPVVAHALGVTPSRAVAAPAASPTPTAVPKRSAAERRAANVETSVGLFASPGDSDITKVVAPALSAAADSLDHDLLHGAALGGYTIFQRLGAGGMGAVYLARQNSLDRNVALKVLAPNLAQDPQFVARFTREAYAAAQLTHHNVVQIHDIGAQDDLHFFSMEFVEGQTLSHLVEEHGKVDVEQAVGFVLQAARGLKYAHDHGLIHRDIKPENLLLNDHGIVKVADLGLVKRANVNETSVPSRAVGTSGAHDSGKTEANMSMGTPAYMSPEQAADAARVDQRADIYSLGCTLYDLLTGRPPFTGHTAQEVITKHQRQAVVPPDMVVKNVPKSLSAILMKMVAKQPEQRYQTMGEVIAVLEDFLGVATAGPFTPKEEHVKVLEFGVERFNQSKWVTIRKVAIGLFYLICAALAVFVGATRPDPLAKVQWTGAFIGLAVLTTLAYQFTIGLTTRTPQFIKVRQLVFGASIGDFILWMLGIIAVCAVLVVFNQHIGWLIVAGVSVLVACAFHWTIDLALSRERQTPIEQVEGMLKQMRLRGLDENALRQFVCKYAGRHWEEFYETLFGYEAKLQARTLWGRSERRRERPRWAVWRDPIVRTIEGRLAQRREMRERRLLAKIEAKALRAKGIREDLARKQARENARAMVNRAHKLRSTHAARLAETVAPGATVTGGESKSVMITKDVALEGAIAAMLRGGALEAENGEHRRRELTEDDEEYERSHESWFKRRFGTPLDMILAPMIRLILAVIVLGGFTVWWKQNSGDQAAREALDVANRRRQIDITGQFHDIKGQIIDAGSDVKEGVQSAAAKTGTKPLQLFPSSWDSLNRATEPFGGWNAGLAGLLLLLSVFFTGRVMSVLVIASALMAMLGHRFQLPAIGYPAPWMSAAAAVLLWVFAVIFFRHREGY
jgi:hypothetical protein